MKQIIRNLLECGRQGNIKDLQQCVEQFDADQIEKIVTKYILRDEFTQLMKYFLDGLTQSGHSQIMRYKITQSILEQFSKQDIPLTKANSLTSRLKLEVTNFSTKHLVKLCDLCVQNIIALGNEDDDDESKTASHMCWKELLPTMLSILLDSGKVVHNGTQMSSEEYKSQIVRSLCQAKWNSEIATSLVSMFVNLKLTTEEHLQVVNKACSRMHNLRPQEVPPVVHEMLELCKNQHGINLMMKVNHYFHSRITGSKKMYLGNIPPSQMNVYESEEIEGDTLQESKQALCTVMYHIHDVVPRHTSIKDFLSLMKKISRGAPEIVLQPVIVSILFCIGTVSTFEEQVFSILRAAIVRSCTERELKKDSAWMREIKVVKFDLQELFNILIDCSKSGQLGVEEGLVNVAFELLKYPSQKSKAASADQVWYYGIYILLKLLRQQRHIANSVLQRICDSIITGESVQQYTMCLGQMCREMRLTVMEQQNIIINLLGYLRVIDPSVSRNIVLAILPIVLVSPTVRDNLILVLRKSLFSREMAARKMAVNGFVDILKNMKLDDVSLGQLSQGWSGSSCSFVGQNILSQVSVEVHNQVPGNINSNTKEAICLEVLSALRGCLSRQAELRATLYTGLMEVIKSNPPLVSPILFWLRSHFLKQCEADDLPPLKFSSCVSVQGLSVVLQEPLGLLVHLVQQVVVTAKKYEGQLDLQCLGAVTDILEKLVDNMSRSHLGNFDLDEHVRLMDQSLENQQAAEVLKQAIAVYEAMLCYCINTWTVNTAEQGNRMLALYKAYARLIEFAKNAVTGSAGTKKETEASSSGRTQADKKKKPGRSALFKLPETILGPSFLTRMLDLLHMNEVPWATQHAVTSVKGRREFHRFAIGIVVQYVGQLKQQLSSGNMSNFKGCGKLASKLFEHCISRLNEVDSFDRPVTVQILEAFLELIQMALTYGRTKWPEFLQRMTNISAEQGVGTQLEVIIEKLHSFLLEDLSKEEDSENDIVDKKMHQILANTVSLLAMELPSQSPQCSQVLELIRTMCSEQRLENPQVVRILLQLLIDLTIRVKVETQLLMNIAKQLQDKIGILPDMEAEDLNETNRMACVNSSTKHVALSVVCHGLKGRLEEVDWVTLRLGSEHLVHNYYTDETEMQTSKELLKSKEREVVCHVARAVQGAVSLSICAPPVGPNADSLLRMHSDIFDTLTRVTKYFTKRSTKDNKVFEFARFDKVIKQSGNALAKNMFAFVSFIGERKNAEGGKKKRDLKSLQSKVLKETRLIPHLIRRKETFDQCAIKLAKDCKAENLLDIVRHHTARDFNIKPQTVKRALEEITSNENDTSIDDDEEDDAGDKENESDGNGEEEEESEKSKNISDSEEEDKQPAKKKKKSKPSK